MDSLDALLWFAIMFCVLALVEIGNGWALPLAFMVIVLSFIEGTRNGKR